MPLKIGERSDLLPEPARSLGAGREAVDLGQPVLVIDLLLQLVAAAIELPREELAVLRPERHVEKNASAGILPVWNAAAVKQASTEPLEAASKHSSAGTSAPGS